MIITCTIGDSTKSITNKHEHWARIITKMPQYTCITKKLVTHSCNGFSNYMKIHFNQNCNDNCALQCWPDTSCTYGIMVPFFGPNDHQTLYPDIQQH